jgi:hypothetical protein
VTKININKDNYEHDLPIVLQFFWKNNISTSNRMKAGINAFEAKFNNNLTET